MRNTFVNHSSAAKKDFLLHIAAFQSSLNCTERADTYDLTVSYANVSVTSKKTMEN